MDYYSDKNALIDSKYDIEFSLPPVKISNHAKLRQKERIPKTHLGEKQFNIIKNNTIVTTIIKNNNKNKNNNNNNILYDDYIECNNEIIPKLIGKKGGNIKTLLYRVKSITNDKTIKFNIIKINNKISNINITTEVKSNLKFIKKELNNYLLLL
jgi:carboxypeptidase C (cathepsin A)